MVKRYGLILVLFAATVLLALAAVTQRLNADGVTGGGTAASAGGTVRLGGAIDGFGLPAGYGAVSQGGGRRLEVGQVPALVAPNPSNAADPAWLQMERTR